MYMCYITEALASLPHDCSTNDSGVEVENGTLILMDSWSGQTNDQVRSSLENEGVEVLQIPDG